MIPALFYMDEITHTFPKIDYSLGNPAQAKETLNSLAQDSYYSEYHGSFNLSIHDDWESFPW